MTKHREESPAWVRYRELIEAKLMLRKVSEIATTIAQQRLQPGDRVSRTLCGGRTGTFTFTGWDGRWACGKGVFDCSVLAIIKINDKPVEFIAEAFAQIDLEPVDFCPELNAHSATEGIR